MKVLLFGATGMVGQGVLRECLLDPQSRYAAIELALTGFEACFFCFGVSSGGMWNEERGIRTSGPKRVLESKDIRVAGTRLAAPQ